MNRHSLMKMLSLQGITSAQVLAAIEKVPREKFVAEGYIEEAYENHPLPIGHQQTISQPYVVAKMTEILITETTHKVLEIGTGSGYQAAILSQLVEEVYTVERILPLLEQAKTKFAQLHYDNIHTHYGDGYDGWAAHAPYDAIMVTAAAPEIPSLLLAQLSPQQGRLLLPVGEAHSGQQLQLIIRQENTYHTTLFDPVVFVPLLKGTTEK